MPEGLRRAERMRPRFTPPIPRDAPVGELEGRMGLRGTRLLRCEDALLPNELVGELLRLIVGERVPPAGLRGMLETTDLMRCIYAIIKRKISHATVNNTTRNPLLKTL